MKLQEIKTVSYVHVGDKLVNTDDLDDEKRTRLGTWIRYSMNSSLFLGEAVFYYPPGQEPPKVLPVARAEDLPRIKAAIAAANAK